MTSIADFIKISKKDKHNNLDLGMRYSSYTLWSGFYIPDFPEDGICYEKDQQNEIKQYTQIRVDSKKDIKSLLSLSISELVADNVSEVDGTINCNLIKCTETPEYFVEIIREIQDKYSNQIKINPILAIDTDSLDHTSLILAETLLGSQEFSGIHFYGKDFSINADKYKTFAETAKEHNLTIKFSASDFSSENELYHAYKQILPNCIVNGENLINNDNFLSDLRNNNTSLIITPNTSTKLLSPWKEKANHLKLFMDKNINVSLGTEGILFLNKSISEFAMELCNCEIFTKDEIINLIKN